MFITSIRAWQTDHKLQTGKVTFWDHNFQLPSNKLESTQPSLFTAGDNKKLEDLFKKIKEKKVENLNNDDNYTESYYNFYNELVG